MPRSSYLYLILVEGIPEAGFTVKYECESYLNRNYPKHNSRIKIFRLPDGDSRLKSAKDITSDFYPQNKVDKPML